MTIRDLQKSDGQWTRAKGFDSSCPVGPRIVAGLDPSNLRIEVRVNGEVRQHGHISDMAYDVPAILEFVSGIMTLEPGDLVATGTPDGISALTAGDLVEIEISGVGAVTNPVVQG